MSVRIGCVGPTPRLRESLREAAGRTPGAELVEPWEPGGPATCDWCIAGSPGDRARALASGALPPYRVVDAGLLGPDGSAPPDALEQLMRRMTEIGPHRRPFSPLLLGAARVVARRWKTSVDHRRERSAAAGTSDISRAARDEARRETILAAREAARGKKLEERQAAKIAATAARAARAEAAAARAAAPGPSTPQLVAERPSGPQPLFDRRPPKSPRLRPAYRLVRKSVRWGGPASLSVEEP
ncbi:MAG: hypothetical protein AB7O67_04400 [Vicinamibacterales bacterium]